MANRQLPEGKRIHVYRSGDQHFTGASLVVNPLQVKTLDNLLTDVTSKVEPNWGAVRSIHTPNQGTVITSLEDLNKKGVYVAAGPKGFVSIPGGYENIGKPLPKNKLQDSQKTIRKVGVRNEQFSISLYKNGLEDAPVAFKYSSKDFSNWDQVLYRMSEKVKLPQGAVKRLYHTNGKIVKKPEEMVNDGSYVAAASNEQFRKVNYGEQDPQSYSKSSAPSRGARKHSNPSRGQRATDSNSSDSNRRTFSKGPTRRRGTRKKGEKGEEEGEEEDGDDEEDKEKRRGGLRRSDQPRGRSKSQPRGRTTSQLRQKGTSSSVSPSRRSSEPSGASGASGEEAGPEGGALGKAAAPPSAVSRRSKSTYDIPLQIPENDDPAQIDYFKLQSNRPTPVTSPESSPRPSRPTSADRSYEGQGRQAGSGFYAIEEEVEEDPLAASGNHLTSSRYSTVDSGRGSLFSDEERPDSVFRAKMKSRPMTRAREVDYDTDDGGIYRAKTRGDYSRGAKEVMDSTDTKIELPVDFFDATEVQEEIYAN